MSAEWDESQAQSARPGVPGAQLAAQREAMGLTVTQIAEQLKLAPRQVVALEAGDYAALPTAAVVRGFVRAYAKVVKLDAGPLVAMIALDAPTGDEASTPIRRDKPASFSEVRFPTNGKRAFPLGWLIAAVVLAVGGFVAYQMGVIPAHLLQRADPGAASASASAVASAPADKPALAPLDTTLVKADQPVASAPASVVPLISVAPAPVASQPAAAAADAAVAPAAPAAANNALVVNVRQDSWIELRRSGSNGAPLIARLVRGGSTETFDITAPVLLIVGKPSAVDVTLRGEAVELKSIAGGTTSRVNLK